MRQNNHEHNLRRNETRAHNQVLALSLISEILKRDLGSAQYGLWLQGLPGYARMTLGQRYKVHWIKLQDLKAVAANEKRSRLQGSTNPETGEK
jgi:hypothetical protein